MLLSGANPIKISTPYRTNLQVCPKAPKQCASTNTHNGTLLCFLQLLLLLLHQACRGLQEMSTIFSILQNLHKIYTSIQSLQISFIWLDFLLFIIWNKIRNEKKLLRKREVQYINSHKDNLHLILLKCTWEQKIIHGSLAQRHFMSNLKAQTI